LKLNNHSIAYILKNSQELICENSWNLSDFML